MVHVSVGSALAVSPLARWAGAPHLAASLQHFWQNQTSTAWPPSQWESSTSETNGGEGGGDPTPAGLVKVNSGSEWGDVLRPPEKDFKCLHTCVHNASTWLEGRGFFLCLFLLFFPSVFTCLVARAEFVFASGSVSAAHRQSEACNQRQQLLGDLVARTKRWLNISSRERVRAEQSRAVCTAALSSASGTFDKLKHTYTQKLAHAFFFFLNSFLDDTAIFQHKLWPSKGCDFLINFCVKTMDWQFNL